MFKPNYKLVQHSQYKDTIVASINFFPDFNKLTTDQAKAKISSGMYDETPETLKTDYENSKGEFIFIIDRSGSMNGKRISKARSALISFLKQLPKNAYFNIISYGSTFHYMFTYSQHKSKIDEAIENVKTFRADMGGTEILAPIEDITRKSLKENYHRYVFLLTDGQVSNTN